MKILIIGCFDYYFHPYVAKYSGYFEKNNIEYKFLYWNRQESSRPTNNNFVAFECRTDSYTSVIKKIRGYLAYRKYVVQYIKKNNFDKCIVLATQTMVICKRIVFKYFKNAYVFDFRDETYEKYSLYRKMVENCIEKSDFTVISSPEFKSIFQNKFQNKFILCHNNKINYFSIKNNYHKQFPLRLTFWGMIRQYRYFYRLIDLFSNDSRFVVAFHGEGYVKQLQQYVVDRGYWNIIITGHYEQQDISSFVRGTDILINAYSNNSTQYRALTVKLYDGIFYELPQIVQSNSFVDNFLSQRGCGKLDLNFDFLDLNQKDLVLNEFIYKYYHLSISSMRSAYSKIRQEISQDDRHFYSFLKKFAKKEG